MALIHPSALVDPGAQLHDSVTVGPCTIIGPHVRIGAGTTVASHCVIEGRTTIGEDNRIFQFNSLGAVPQDKKYAGEPCELMIRRPQYHSGILYFQYRYSARPRHHSRR